MKRYDGLLLLALNLALIAPAQAERIITYAIDPGRTRIGFNWTYLGATSPTGSFSNARGYIYGNLDQPEASWAEVSIPVKTLRTFMPLIDRELLGSGDFFKPREYPEMHFRSNGIMHVDKEDKAFSLTGTLTVNGITRPVILSAKTNSSGASPFAGGGQSASLTATTSFRRSEFGMTRLLGVVGDEMKVSLVVHAVETNPATTPVARSTP